jgi:hypothetical protein
MRIRESLSKIVCATICALLVSLALTICFLQRGPSQLPLSATAYDRIHLYAWRLGIADAPPMSYLEALVRDVMIDCAVPDEQWFQSEETVRGAKETCLQDP